MKIVNAHILTMDGAKGVGREIENGSIEIKNGKIYKISEKSEDFESGDIDANGRTVIPGFIDAHTHVGIIENGIGFEGDDCNEATDPFMPQLRSIDGINPFDRCFSEALKRGVTSLAVCPGSANACGGQISAMKTCGNWIDDMFVKTAGVKFALGENPKSTYNDRDETPITRMGTVAIIREGLYKAKRYIDDIKKSEEESGDLPDYDAKCEALIPLLNREICAHFHSHRADDIQTAIRIAKEFNLRLVIVHGTDGAKIADGISRSGFPVIVGPIISERCKPELCGQEVTTAGILYKHGVKIAICTDHDVIPIQYLPLEAQIACKNGLPHDEALRAITINPAEILGIDSRCGKIAVGLDADLQIYSHDPISLDYPDIVIANGKII